MPAQYDFQTIRGNDLPIRLRIRPLDGTGSTFTFRCCSQQAGARTFLCKSTDDGTLTASVAQSPSAPGEMVTSLDLVLSAAETRALAEGRTNPYELERSSDREERTLLSGHIIVDAGVNDDV